MERYEEDEEENEDEADEESGSKTAGKSKCDNRETCLCCKPAKDHPEHEWVVTYAGFRKWIAQLSMAPLRCPDNFNMYTWNDRKCPFPAGCGRVIYTQAFETDTR